MNPLGDKYPAKQLLIQSRPRHPTIIGWRGFRRIQPRPRSLHGIQRPPDIHARQRVRHAIGRALQRYFSTRLAKRISSLEPVFNVNLALQYALVYK